MLPVHALDGSSEVTVSVCGQSAPPAAIKILQPASDSVIDTAQTTFRGTVENATGIEISVDGGYSQTIALSAGQTMFGTEIVLSPGTHTVTADANGVCGATDATASVVLTYQPRVQTSTGATTPTRIDGGASSQGGNSAVDTSGTAAGASGIDSIPVIGPIVRIFTPLSRGLGLESTVTNGSQPMAVGVARVAAMSLSLVFLVIPNAVLPLLAHGARLSQLLHWSLPKQWSGTRGLLGLRLAGAVLFGALLLL